MADEKVQIVLTAQDRASAQVKGLKANLQALGSRTGGPLGAVTGGFGGLGLGAAGAATGITALGFALGHAAEKVGEFLGQAAAAASDEEENVAKLTAALEANVDGFNGYMGSIESAIKQNEALAFSDDDLRDSLAQLTFVTHDTKRAFEGQSVAMDLARAKHMSLHDASILVGKVLAGNYTGLKRLGIALGDVKDPMAALARLQTIFAGQAEQYAKTTKGQMEALGIEIQDVNEEIGQHLLPTQAKLVQAVHRDVVPALEEWSDKLGTILDFSSGNVDDSELMGFINLFPQFIRDHLPPELTGALTESINTSSRAAFIQSERSEENQHLAEQFGHVIGDGIHGGIQDGISAWDLDKDLAAALSGTPDVVSRAIQKAQLAAAHPNAVGDQAALIQRGLAKIDALEAAGGNAGQMAIYEQSRQVLEDQYTNITAGQQFVPDGQSGWPTAASSSGSWQPSTGVTPHTHPIVVDGKTIIQALDPALGKRLALQSRAPYTRN